jgi:hypothetical protein
MQTTLFEIRVSPLREVLIDRNCVVDAVKGWPVQRAQCLVLSQLTRILLVVA